MNRTAMTAPPVQRPAVLQLAGEPARSDLSTRHFPADSGIGRETIGH
jgi:hypothetical protein